MSEIRRRLMMAQAESIIFADDLILSDCTLVFPTIGDGFEIRFNIQKIEGSSSSQRNWIRLYNDSTQIGYFAAYAGGTHKLDYKLGSFSNNNNTSLFQFATFPSYLSWRNNRIITSVKDIKYTTQSGLSLNRMTITWPDKKKWRLTSIVIKDGGTTVAEYLPAYKDGSKKLYDIINKVWQQ